jgi:hypothetical protein
MSRKMYGTNFFQMTQEFNISIKWRSSMAPRSVRFGVRSQKLSIVGQSLDG